jgi:hypothetical protein
VVSPYLIARQHQVEYTNSTPSHGVEPPLTDPASQPSSQPVSLRPPVAQSSVPNRPAQPQRPSEVALSGPAPAPPEDADRATSARARPTQLAPITPPTETVVAPGNASVALHDPLTRPGASWIQNHLRDLGYNVGDSEGIWGLNSRSALKEFKTRSGLPADDAWDAATEANLGVLVRTKTDQTFQGAWAQRAGDCEIEAAARLSKYPKKALLRRLQTVILDTCSKRPRDGMYKVSVTATARSGGLIYTCHWLETPLFGPANEVR